MAYPPPPYADAVCGTPLCGEAIAGAWWLYPSDAGLRLGGVVPAIFIPVGDEVPAAGLGLGASPLFARVSLAVSVTSAGLRLGTEAPTLQFAYVLLVDPAGLGLGAVKPTRVAALYLIPLVCIDIPLAADPERVLALAGAPERSLALTESECR